MTPRKPAKKRTTVRLTDENYLYLNSLAEKRGTDMNTEVNRMVEEKREQ